MNKKLLALYGLKFNPFSSQVPTDALWISPPIEDFCWRIEQQVGEGGFALVSGDPGTGKSAALRLLAERLARVRDLTVGVLTRPQASLADFYRELGHLFGVALSPHNRWASAKVLREKWLQHQDTARLRPVLLVDEAQETGLAVFSELRLLSSADLDSRSILTVILAGDSPPGHPPGNRWTSCPWPAASAAACAPKAAASPTTPGLPQPSAPPPAIPNSSPQPWPKPFANMPPVICACS